MNKNIPNKKESFNLPLIESETIESLSAKLLTVTAQLTETNKELIRVQKERETMISNISHDLRAPLTAIRSSIDYLMSAKNLSKEDVDSALALMNRRTKILEDLIQDMYYLFCVEDTSKELNLETVDATPFLEEYFYDALADTRFDTHDMRLELAENLGCKIRVDIPKLVRVLDNLFTNAAKYTPEDSCIVLESHVDSSANRLIISILDNGPGIPEESLPHIFQRTYTVSSARTPGAPSGSGLGLSIVKAIMERHGGTVFCESELGKGCRFTLTLPISDI